MATCSIKISKTILSLLVHLDVDPDEAANYFGSCVERMIKCEPNYRLYSKSTPESGWVLRDFYPNTHILFKIGIQKNPINHNILYAKIRIVENIAQKSGYVLMNLDMTKSRSNAIVESITLGSEIEIPNLIKDKIQRPRRMFPKGYK